jgi:hypothetical protein
MAEYQIKEDATINGVTINITSADGSQISPSYEAHSLDKVNEIVNSNLSLISAGDKIEVTIY